MIFSRNGADFTSRWSAIAYALQHLPAKSAIIDAEVVANNAKGMPDFAALHRRTAAPSTDGGGGVAVRDRASKRRLCSKRR